MQGVGLSGSLGASASLLGMRRVRMGPSVCVFGQNPSDLLASCWPRMVKSGSNHHPLQVRMLKGPI